jgi:hypothetical protein
VAALETELEKAESEILTALKVGHKVQPGLLAAYVKSWERRDVSWKNVVVARLGQAEADRVLAGAPPVQHEKLVVEVAG